MRAGAANPDAWDHEEPPPVPRVAETKPVQVREDGVRTLAEPPAPKSPLAEVDSGEAEPLKLRGGPSKPKRGVPKQLAGRVLGTFRNTYYDFPSESEFTGDAVSLYDGSCRPLTRVNRGFFEAVCVQGSGLLSSGSPISFNRRDCDCAELCPRTGQRICFDSLELARFPWGRGAMGQAITPLLTIAVDSAEIPLGTSVYIPEFEGLPRELSGGGSHDGCFIAQDRGLKVQGKHVDVFTGQRAMTRRWNGLVGSNAGVTVVVDSPHCARDTSR